MPGKAVSKLKKELSSEELLAQLERRRGTFFEHLVGDDADSDFVDRLVTRARGMLNEDGSHSAQTEVDTSKGKEVAADFTSAEKDLRDAVLSDEILSAINTLADKLPEAGRTQAIEEFKQVAVKALQPKKKFISKKDLTDDDLNNPLVLRAHISFANQHKNTDPSTLEPDEAHKLRKARLVRKYDIDRRHMSSLQR